MHTEKVRLEKLSLQIAHKRNQGRVKSWSSEIKQECLKLVKIFGIKKVSEETKLRYTLISLWINKYSIESDVQSPKLVAEDISVTRISLTQKSSQIKYEPLIQINTQQIKIKVFCPRLAKAVILRVINS